MLVSHQALPLCVNWTVIIFASLSMSSAELEAPSSFCDRKSASTDDFHNGMFRFFVISIVVNRKTVARSHNVMGPMSHRKSTRMKVSEAQATPVAVMLSPTSGSSLMLDVKSIKNGGLGTILWFEHLRIAYAGGEIAHSVSKSLF